MKKIRLLLFVVLLLAGPHLFAQPAGNKKNADTSAAGYVIKPRMRIIIDNDFGGDPDGLFALVHHLLSPSVDIRAIVGSHLKPGDGFDPSNETALHARQKIDEVLGIMNLTGKFAVYQGSNSPLENISTPQHSAAADAIIAEAMRDDTKLPLYVVCGAGLTDLASAYLLEPKIAGRLTLVWIGGPEYTDLALPPPGYTSLEYNLGIDIRAGQVIFNTSGIPIWQVPRNAYRQVLLPYSSLQVQIKPAGKIGAWLSNTLENLLQKIAKFNLNLGETYILGDSPLVLLTALQSSFEADPSSSFYALHPRPIINSLGLYETNEKAGNIRVYTQLDTRLLLEDLYAKLWMFNQQK